MTAPLNKDGSNFPAKKYATKAKLDSLKPVATLVAGQEFSWGLGGTATHNGGSCQVAIRYVSRDSVVPWRRCGEGLCVAADRSKPVPCELTRTCPLCSYDMMETMVVIASWVGGCPLSQ